MQGSDILTYNPGSYMAGRYYNVNSTSFKEVFYVTDNITSTNSFNVTISATKGSITYPVDVVVFDPETTNSGSNGQENITYSTTGSSFTLLEKTGTGTINETSITGAGTNTLNYINTQNTNVNAFYVTTGYTPTITASTKMTNSRQALGFGIRVYCDTDSDGTPDYLDVDSDGDGCADAVEGSENVLRDQIHDLELPASDANYAYRGQIKVAYNGTSINTPTNIISKSANANGVPQLVNNAGNNFNSVTNASNLAGVKDNSDSTAEVGQGIGSAKNALINVCFCYKAPVKDAGAGTTLDTQVGITALGRAGSVWPMIRKSGWIALEAKTKGFVINRVANVSSITTPVEGMIVFDISADCLKVYTYKDTVLGWFCMNTQTCPE